VFSHFSCFGVWFLIFVYFFCVDLERGFCRNEVIVWDDFWVLFKGDALESFGGNLLWGNKFCCLKFMSWLVLGYFFV
jgi:hypothetical protein